MCHVLVIEDEPIIAMLLQDIFEEAGATSFDFAATEQEAVALAIQHAPAIISSDVRLLEGTGPHAVRTIHQQLGEVPVIFLTATPQDCGSWAAHAVILMKPFDARQVKDVFQQLAPV